MTKEIKGLAKVVMGTAIIGALFGVGGCGTMFNSPNYSYRFDDKKMIAYANSEEGMKNFPKKYKKQGYKVQLDEKPREASHLLEIPILPFSKCLQK